MNKGIERAIYFFRTPKIMAEKLGVSRQVISAWKNGHVKMSAYHAIRIERATKGEITIDDLIDVEEI